MTIFNVLPKQLSIAAHLGRRAFWCLLQAAPFVLYGCGGDSGGPAGPSSTPPAGPSETPTVATVSVTGARPLAVGQVIQLSATARDAAGHQLSGQSISWESKSPSVASVSGEGVVTARAAGTAVITATASGRTGEASVSVLEVNAASFSLNLSTFTIASHQTVRIDATAKDPSGVSISSDLISWSTSNPNVVAVRSDGSLEGVSAGTAVVTGTLGGKTATATATVVAFASIAAGSRDICALTPDGVMYCAGMRFGDRGRPVWTSMRWSQVDEDGDTEGLPVAHACGVTLDGAVWCWGTNSSGELGVGDLVDHDSPVSVSIPERVVQVSAGAFHTCALAVSGSIYCWGKNTFGQLGNGNGSDSATPVHVTGGSRFSRLSAGLQHTCALTLQQSVVCWGRNLLGELGRGTWSETEKNPTPALVQSPASFTDISVQQSHSCALATDGQIFCWGANTVFELGQVTVELCSGQHPCSTTPKPVSGGKTFTAIAASMFGGCGLVGESAYCWGMDIQSTLGTTQTVPTCNVTGAARGCTGSPLAGPTLFKTLSGSERNYCGIRKDGGAYCWGGNKRGQLGVPTLEETAVPAVFALDSTVVPP